MAAQHATRSVTELHGVPTASLVRDGAALVIGSVWKGHLAKSDPCCNALQLALECALRPAQTAPPANAVTAGTHMSPSLSMVAQQAVLSAMALQLTVERVRGSHRRVDEPSNALRGAMGAKTRVPTAQVASLLSPATLHSSIIQYRCPPTSSTGRETPVEEAFSGGKIGHDGGAMVEVTNGADGGGANVERARVSRGAAVSSPLHVRLLSTLWRSMKIYVALIGASNQPCVRERARHEGHRRWGEACMRVRGGGMHKRGGRATRRCCHAVVV